MSADAVPAAELPAEPAPGAPSPYSSASSDRLEPAPPAICIPPQNQAESTPKGVHPPATVPQADGVLAPALGAAVKPPQPPPQLGATAKPSASSYLITAIAAARQQPDPTAALNALSALNAPISLASSSAAASLSQKSPREPTAEYREFRKQTLSFMAYHGLSPFLLPFLSKQTGLHSAHVFELIKKQLAKDRQEQTQAGDTAAAGPDAAPPSTAADAAEQGAASNAGLGQPDSDYKEQEDTAPFMDMLNDGGYNMRHSSGIDGRFKTPSVFKFVRPAPSPPKVYEIEKNAKGFYCCPCCPYTAQWKSWIKRHLRTHTGEKPYECPVCDFCSAEKSNLTAHVKTHGRKRRRGDHPRTDCANSVHELNAKRQRIEHGLSEPQVAAATAMTNWSMNKFVPPLTEQQPMQQQIRIQHHQQVQQQQQLHFQQRMQMRQRQRQQMQQMLIWHMQRRMQRERQQQMHPKMHPQMHLQQHCRFMEQPMQQQQHMQMRNQMQMQMQQMPPQQRIQEQQMQQIQPPAITGRAMEMVGLSQACPEPCSASAATRPIMALPYSQGQTPALNIHNHRNISGGML